MIFRHSEMFKAQVLALKKSGHKTSELTKRYKLGHSTISRWEKEQEKSEKISKTAHLPKSETQKNAERIRELELELSQMKDEQEILKAAVSLLCKKKIEK